MVSHRVVAPKIQMESITAMNLTIALAFATGVAFLVFGLLQFDWISNFIGAAALFDFIEYARRYGVAVYLAHVYEAVKQFHICTLVLCPFTS